MVTYRKKNCQTDLKKATKIFNKNIDAPLNTYNAQDAVYDGLLKAITSGKIAPGERITIADISLELGVSRTPVREAIKRLEARGFVRRDLARRFFVAQLSKDEFEQLLTIRIILESHAAEIAAKRRTDQSVNELREINDRIVQADNPEDIYKYNQHFHKIIYREAGLPILDDIINSMWERVSPYLFLLIISHKAEEFYQWEHWHQGMINGLEQKDSEIIKSNLVGDLKSSADHIFEFL